MNYVKIFKQYKPNKLLKKAKPLTWWNTLARPLESEVMEVLSHLFRAITSAVDAEKMFSSFYLVLYNSMTNSHKVEKLSRNRKK